MRYLGVDYSKEEDILALSVAECVDDKLHVIESCSLNPKNKQEAMDMTEYFFKKYNCQKVFSEDLYIELLK